MLYVSLLCTTLIVALYNIKQLHMHFGKNYTSTKSYLPAVREDRGEGLPVNQKGSVLNGHFGSTRGYSSSRREIILEKTHFHF